MTEQEFFVAAVPVFLAAVLGVAVGLFTDWLKTRRENRKLSRERQEKELTQLNVVATAMGYNIEVLLQQSCSKYCRITSRVMLPLPHYVP